MSPVGAGAAVDHHRHQVVHPVGVDGVVRGVEQPELQGEDNTVGDLDVSVVLLHIFKPLEMQRQNCGQLLHSHSLVGLLNVIRLHPLS